MNYRVGFGFGKGPLEYEQKARIKCKLFITAFYLFV